MREFWLIASVVLDDNVDEGKSRKVQPKIRVVSSEERVVIEASWVVRVHEP